MATVNLPAPKTAPAPTGPKFPPPATKSPGQIHHTPPRNIPTGTPATRPIPVRVGPAIIVAVGTLTDRISCPIGKDLKRRKKFPKKGDPKKGEPGHRRRQRPCKGTGKPTVTFEEKKVKIGRFKVNKITSKLRPGSASLYVEKKTAQVAKKAGYVESEENPVKIIAEVSAPATAVEKLTVTLGGSDVCFYQVYAIERRRKCTCPDGSKCRSTTRKD